MTEDQVREVIAKSKELAGTFFISFKNDIETNILPKLSTDQKKSYLIKEKDKELAKFVKLPSYLLKQDEEIVVTLSVENTPVQYLSAEKPEVIEMFRNLYNVFKIALADEDLNRKILNERTECFSEEFKEHDAIYFNRDNILFYIKELDGALYELPFYRIVHIVVMSYIAFISKKLDYYNNLLSVEKKYGIDCQYDDDAKNEFFKFCQEFIHSSTTLKNFKAAITNREVPMDFTPIKWTVKRGNKPVQQSLIAFYHVVTDLKELSRTRIKDCFEDFKGEKFTISKHSPNTPSFDVWIRKFAQMLPDKERFLEKYQSKSTLY